MIDPIYVHWIIISPIVLAIILGIVVNRARYKDEVEACIKWAKQYKRGK